MFSSPEPKAYKTSLWERTRVGSCASVRPHLQTWGGEKIALDLGPERIKSLVSMATDNSNRVIMGSLL